jgi:hypothetical protein
MTANRSHRPLPQEQQKDALAAAFREDWRTREKHAVPVRELAQWIRENVMLTLAGAVFDCEDAGLVPAAGACVTCPRRTGANTALFDDFAQDDRCMLRGIWPDFKGRVSGITIHRSVPLSMFSIDENEPNLQAADSDAHRGFSRSKFIPIS